MASATWNIDPTHSGIHFSVRHLVVSKVRGSFRQFSGTVSLDTENLAASSVSAVIETASIDTGVEQRDTHLRSADFFDAERFPTLTFQSTRVEPTSSNGFRITGELSLHGVTRQVVLEAEQLGIGKDPWGNTKAAFEAKTSIDRRDFGLTWNQALETGGLLVGEKIEISLEIQAAQAKSADKAA